MLQVDGDVHHVPGVDVARDDEIADQLLVGLYGRDRERALLGELAANIERDHGVGYERARSSRSRRGRRARAAAARAARDPPLRRPGARTYDRLDLVHRAERARERGVERGVAARGAGVVGRDLGTARRRAFRGSGGRRHRCRCAPGGTTSSSGRTARGPGRTPRRRRASITGKAPSHAAARASSVETPATGIRARARARGRRRGRSACR